MPPTFANGKICYIEMPATDTSTAEVGEREVSHRLSALPACEK